MKFLLIIMQHLNYVKQSMIHFMLCFTMEVKILFERSVDYKHSKDLLTSRNLQRMLCIATWCEKVLFVNTISSLLFNKEFNLVAPFFFIFFFTQFPICVRELHEICNFLSKL